MTAYLSSHISDDAEYPPGTELASLTLSNGVKITVTAAGRSFCTDMTAPEGSEADYPAALYHKTYYQAVHHARVLANLHGGKNTPGLIPDIDEREAGEVLFCETHPNGTAVLERSEDFDARCWDVYIRRNDGKTGDVQSFSADAWLLAFNAFEDLCVELENEPKQAPELTPYDTGEILQPRTHNHDRGAVDFDNDESATVFKIAIHRHDEPEADYLIKLDVLGDDTFILDVDSETQDALTILKDAQDGLEALCEFAERGWEDFCHQASYGDYNAEDQKQAEASWEKVKALIEALRSQQG